MQKQLRTLLKPHSREAQVQDVVITFLDQRICLSRQCCVYAMHLLKTHRSLRCTCPRVHKVGNGHHSALLLLSRLHLRSDLRSPWIPLTPPQMIKQKESFEFPIHHTQNFAKDSALHVRRSVQLLPSCTILVACGTQRQGQRAAVARQHGRTCSSAWHLASAKTEAVFPMELSRPTCTKACQSSP